MKPDPSPGLMRVGGFKRLLIPTVTKLNNDDSLVELGGGSTDLLPLYEGFRLYVRLKMV